MTYFKQTVLWQIQSASDEKEIELAVDLSIERLKSKNVNGHIIQQFILSMDKVLCQAKVQGISEKAGQNMDIAIVLFRKLQRP
jgi:hypothetical protein